MYPRTRGAKVKGVRRIVTFFLAASLRVFSGEPSEVALEFLRGFDGDLSDAEIASDLAISPFCGPKKKDRIVESWGARGSLIWSASSLEALQAY